MGSLGFQDLIKHCFEEPWYPIIILKKIVQHLVANGKFVTGHLSPSVSVFGDTSPLREDRWALLLTPVGEATRFANNIEFD